MACRIINPYRWMNEAPWVRMVPTGFCFCVERRCLLCNKVFYEKRLQGRGGAA